MNFLFQCYSTPYLEKSWFNLNSQNGQLFLLHGLNRDLPDMPIYYLPVSGKIKRLQFEIKPRPKCLPYNHQLFPPT